VADDGHGRLLVVGLPASPGVCTGPLATTLDEVLAHPPGTAVLLRPTTEPGDFLAMMHAGALLTLQGGSTSHAAVVARELGLPAVVALTAGDPEWAEGVGDVTVCGTTGRVWAGTVPALPARVLPRPDDLLATASIPGTTMICLPAEDEPGRPCIVDSEGAPLAVIAESPALDAPACGLPPEAPLRVLVCDRPGDLPGEAHGHVVASGDRATAEAWALKGGEVVFLHPAPSGAAWSTELPDCQLLAVVLYAREQVEHAHWVLAARAVRALDPEDR
jgi:phosphohistidine swiveling domain-containing protein